MSLEKAKVGEDILSPSSGTDSGILSFGWSVHQEIVESLEDSLRLMGIPISSVSMTGDDSFCFKLDKPESSDDYLLYADCFHIAKWVIKHETSARGYYANFTPMSSDTQHDVKINLEKDIELN